MFITFEGIDGSGKSTMAQRFFEFLVDHGYSTVNTREPGGTEVGEKLREVFLSGKANDDAALHILVATRLQLLGEVICPALDEGKIVVCDRYVDSTMAYQYFGKQLSYPKVYQACQISTQGVLPDLTFILDVDLETSAQRMAKRGGDLNIFDKEKKDFRQRLRDGYLAIYKHCRDYLEDSLGSESRYVLIDASAEPDQVFENICDVFKERHMRLEMQAQQ